MRLARLVVPVAASVVVASGCGQVQQAADTAKGAATKARECAALARDAIDARVNAPSAAEAERAARRLDDRVRQISDQDVRQAAETLRDKVRQLADAIRAGDRTAIDAAARSVRDAANAAARACNLPVDRFTSG